VSEICIHHGVFEFLSLRATSELIVLSLVVTMWCRNSIRELFGDCSHADSRVINCLQLKPAVVSSVHYKPFLLVVFVNFTFLLYR